MGRLRRDRRDCDSRTARFQVRLTPYRSAAMAETVSSVSLRHDADGAWEAGDMRILGGLVLCVGGLLCSAFVLLLSVHISNGRPIYYLLMTALAAGAFGCFVAARQRFTRT
jgi:hypothetical protein